MPAITLSCTPIADKRNIHTEKQGGESGRRPRSSAAAAPDRPPCPRAGFPPRAPRAKWSPTRIPVHKRLSRDDIANGFLCRHMDSAKSIYSSIFFFSPVKIHTQRHAHSCEQTALRVKSTLLSGPRERLLSAARRAFFPSGPLSIRRCREAAFSTPTGARPLPAVPAERAVTALV